MFGRASSRFSQKIIVTRAKRQVAQKVWQTSGTIATSVTVAIGSLDLWRMWRSNGSGRLVTQNRGKLVPNLWQISGKLVANSSRDNRGKVVAVAI